MALKICRSSGQQFRVGKTVFTVDKVTGNQSCILSSDTGWSTAKFAINQHLHEVEPNVKISCGKSDRQGRTWLTIDAPRDIRIERIQPDDSDVPAPA